MQVVGIDDLSSLVAQLKVFQGQDAALHTADSILCALGGFQSAGTACLHQIALLTVCMGSNHQGSLCEIAAEFLPERSAFLLTGSSGSLSLHVFKSINFYCCHGVSAACLAILFGQRCSALSIYKALVNPTICCCRVRLQPLTLNQAVTIVRAALGKFLRVPTQQKHRTIDAMLGNEQILVQLSELAGVPKYIEIMCRALYSKDAMQFINPMLSDWSSNIATVMRLAFSKKVRTVLCISTIDACVTLTVS